MNGGKTSPVQVDAASLIAEFLKVLSHELRSPLSVMANDLQYLSSPDADRSIGTWKDALNRISATLNAIEKGETAAGEERSFPAHLLLSHTADRLESFPVCDTGSGRIYGSSVTILRAIDEFLKLHQAASRPNLILNSREVSLRLITPEAFPNRQPGRFISSGFSLNRETTTLTLLHAELMLRLSGAAFSSDGNELLISLPVYEASANFVC